MRQAQILAVVMVLEVVHLWDFFLLIICPWCITILNISYALRQDISMLKHTSADVHTEVCKGKILQSDGVCSIYGSISCWLPRRSLAKFQQ